MTLRTVSKVANGFIPRKLGKIMIFAITMIVQGHYSTLDLFFFLPIVSVRNHYDCVQFYALDFFLKDCECSRSPLLCTNTFMPYSFPVIMLL